MLKHCLIFILAVLLIIISCNSLKEGVTFTRYDVNNLLVQPWDSFCVQQMSQCGASPNNILDYIKSPYKCLCDGQKSILDNPPCTDIKYDPFVTFRR